MQVIEFSGIIEVGLIKLPDEYSSFNHQKAKVIVMLSADSEGIPQKKRLAAIFEQMSNKPMFRKIVNPLTWQKQLRNEWD